MCKAKIDERKRGGGGGGYERNEAMWGGVHWRRWEEVGRWGVKWDGGQTPRTALHTMNLCHYNSFGDRHIRG